MIKAIETKYKGYRFRSRLEARWAVFFDAIGFKWEYEKEGFDLGDGIYYLPDFYLPQFNLWIEIKGADASDDEMTTCMLFLGKLLGGESEITDLLCTEIMPRIVGDMINEFNASMDDIRDACNYAHKRPKVIIFEGIMDNAWFVTTSGCVQQKDPSLFFKSLFARAGFKNKKKVFSWVDRAIELSRSARFEHGEIPLFS